MDAHPNTLIRKEATVLLVLLVMIGGAAYVIWTYPWFNRGGQSSGYTKSSSYSTQSNCSGYPPGGNCPGNYSNTFYVSINYTAQWKVTWYGYHSAGENGPVAGNYTGGSYKGTGQSIRGITLTGPNTNGLTLCAVAEKLDSSNATLVLRIDNGIQPKETSSPYGQASLCWAVVP